jgi:hypothetical protein
MFRVKSKAECISFSKKYIPPSDPRLLQEKDEFLGKTCLVLGDGPTKYTVDLREKKDVDIIISSHYAIHEKSDYICSIDATGYRTKELKAVEKGYPLIIGFKFAFLPSQFIPYKNNIKCVNVNDKLFDGVRISNTGFFGIAWAVYKGFKTIYTAGIDFHPSYTRESMEPYKSMINKWENEGIKIYKVHPGSFLPCEVKSL